MTRDAAAFRAEFPGDSARDIVVEAASPDGGFVVRKPAPAAVSLTVMPNLDTAAMVDALDRSHQQPVRRLGTSTRDRAVRIAITARGPLALELWDAEREAALFRRVFGRRLVLAVA
jgi:hypothetical protein